MANDVDEYRIKNLEDSLRRVEAKLDSFDKTFVRIERYMITERAVFAFIGAVMLAAFGFIWRASGGG